MTRLRMKLSIDSVLKFFFDKYIGKLLVLLIIADLCFIFLHSVRYRFHFLDNSLWAIENDEGYAEIYQYIKELWIFVMLALLWIRSLRLIYISWGVLFLYLLIDDSVHLHEQFGWTIADIFNFHEAFGLRAKDFGEIVVSVVAAFTLFIFIVLGYILSTPQGKKMSLYLLVLVAALAFFGIFVDMIHEITNEGFYLGVLEDGGEMLVMSIITAYVFSLKPEERSAFS